FGRGDDRRERSAADREAARLERERRRAQREGRPVPEEPPARDEPAEAPVQEDAARDEPPADDDQPAGEDAHEDPPAGDDPRDESSAPEEPQWAPLPDDPEPEDPEPEGEPDDEAEAVDVPPEPPPDPRPDPEPRWHDPGPEPVPGAVDPQATQPLEPVGAIHARRTVSLPRPQTEELGHHTDSWDRPIGTVRVSRGDYQAQPGAPGMPPHRNLGVQKTRRRWVRRFVVMLLVLALAAIAVFGFMLYQPFHGKGYDAVVVKIPPGSSAGEIGDLLSSKGVVDSGFFFALRARLGGDRGNLRAGTYTLKKSMPYKDALAALTEAPKSAPTIDVTLPEGPSRRELAPRVAQAGVRGSYVKASARSSVLSPRTYGAPKATKTLEGFLFPDTYELRSRTATAKQLVGMQLRTFKREFAKVDLKRARRKHLSRYDVLIIASMIEREAQVPKDRRLISAVIYNRLQRGIPLGIDATLRYRLNNWSKALRESELNIDSDYNTRRRIGLPPTPIGNPGLASIQAAADPASSKYIFYVVKPCGNGAHAFSSTDAQFQKDVAAYNRARDKNGGKDPSHCKN
ncbi:MAG TPA: endolytic transglycosylase MltG, partial [Solirubrobacteraceae bacterium]|nr:endolytic transglycosylase MltG [Solirubrobacteraceae bacterium]